MKQILIIALIFIVSISAHAQSKKSDTTKKIFQPDLSTVVSIQLKLPLVSVNDYLYSLQNPGYQTSDLSGKNIAIINQHIGQVVDSIATAYNLILAGQYRKFVADTTKKVTSFKTPNK